MVLVVKEEVLAICKDIIWVLLAAEHRCRTISWSYIMSSDLGCRFRAVWRWSSVRWSLSVGTLSSRHGISTRGKSIFILTVFWESCSCWVNMRAQVDVWISEFISYLDPLLGADDLIGLFMTPLHFTSSSIRWTDDWSATYAANHRRVYSRVRRARQVFIM